MIIANDHYQSIAIVCLSVIRGRAFKVSQVSGLSALILYVFLIHELITVR